jgi:SAM-dependent methyltransferase
LAGTDYDSFAHFYELEYQNYSVDLDFYRQFALRCGSPILELACGTGRLLVSLARAGYSVTGLDLSPAMLAIARQKLAAEEPAVRDRVRLIEADMRHFALDERYTLVFCAINSFMHLLTQADQVRALRCVQAHLQENGLLILDLFNPDLYLALGGSGQVTYDGDFSDPAHGTKVHKFVVSWVDRPRQIHHMTFLYDEVAADGTVHRTTAAIRQRYLYRYEAELLLERCGFVTEHVYGTYDLDEYSGDSFKMLIVARKAG